MGLPGNPCQQGEKGDKGESGNKRQKGDQGDPGSGVFLEKRETKGKLGHGGFQKLLDHLVTQYNPDHIPAGAITYHLIVFSSVFYLYI